MAVGGHDLILDLIAAGWQLGHDNNKLCGRAAAIRAANKLDLVALAIQ